MKILLLGNSFSSVNNFARLLSDLSGGEVVSHTRGGARLAEHLNRNTKLGAMTSAALESGQFDFVVMQEMSNGPALHREAFLRSAGSLCALVHNSGAVPVFYGTWAYQENSPALKRTGLGYVEMMNLLRGAYEKAARDNGALLADCGRVFFERGRAGELLYAADGRHPNAAGSRVAAEVVAGVILNGMNNSNTYE